MSKKQLYKSGNKSINTKCLLLFDTIYKILVSPLDIDAYNLIINSARCGTHCEWCEKENTVRITDGFFSSSTLCQEVVFVFITRFVVGFTYSYRHARKFNKKQQKQNNSITAAVWPQKIPQTQLVRLILYSAYKKIKCWKSKRAKNVLYKWRAEW